MGEIYIIDVTNRDGVQTAKLGLSKLEKTMINLYLNELGVYQSEFGFPTTKHESNYLKANLRLAEMGVLQPIRLGGWIRATAGGCGNCLQTGPQYTPSQSLCFYLNADDCREVSGQKDQR